VTDLRTQLADVFRGHWYSASTHSCHCGSTVPRPYHIADLLLSQFAAVELPEETTIPDGWGGCLGAWPADVKGVADPVSAWPSRDEEIADPEGEFCTVAEARAFAGALLAAANKVERYKRERDQ
jgi:hypothetical protein